MSQVQIEPKSYEMPPLDGFTVAHLLTVADISGTMKYAGPELSLAQRRGLPLEPIRSSNGFVVTLLAAFAQIVISSNIERKSTWTVQMG